MGLHPEFPPSPYAPLVPSQRWFPNDPVLPSNGHDGRNRHDDFQITLHIQDDVRAVRETGNIFLTNIHRVFLSDVSDPSLEDDDRRDCFLDPSFKSIQAIHHKMLQKERRLALQVDVTATPRHDNDDTRNCDDVGVHLEKVCPELQGAVLVIHTKKNGEISEAASGRSKEELELHGKQSNEIDA